MFIVDLPNQAAPRFLVPAAARTNSVTNLAGADVSQWVGNIALIATFKGIAVGTTKTVTITIQHNDVAAGGDAGWANVPADALIDPATGEPATFPVVGTTDYTAYLALVKELVKPYVRAVLTCGSANVEHVGAIVALGQKRYSYAE